MTSDAEACLHKAKHIQYWQRCHSTYLPSIYTPNDSIRLLLAGFTVSALDLLSVPLTPQDRNAIRRWVLSLQHPEGGFCGSPAHALHGHNAATGTANIASTFFALLLLATAAESDSEAKAAFSGVETVKLLRWLKKLQREDGSFGQNLWDGEPVGGNDMRHNYLAACIRWMVRGSTQEDEDIDVDKMVAYIREAQTYDGGFAESSSHESHAGYAFCAIAALDTLDRLPSTSSSESRKITDLGIGDRHKLLTFLAHRQSVYIPKEDDSDEEEAEGENVIESGLAGLKLDEGWNQVGFNGRWNKNLDTCYTWWVGGTLSLLKDAELMNSPPSRNFLLDAVQHRIGGFSKGPGGPPDIYHAYLGLAALAMMGEDDLKEFDVGLCCSKDVTRKIELARDGVLETRGENRQQKWDGDGFWAAAGEGNG